MKTTILTKIALVLAALYLVCPGMSWAEAPEYDITIGRTINVPGPSGLVYRDDGFWVISWNIREGTRLRHYSADRDTWGEELGNYAVPEVYLVQGLAWDGKYWWIADNIHPSGDKIEKCELTRTGLNILKEYIWPGPGSGPVALEWAQGYLWVADNHSDLICRVSVGDTSFTSVTPWSSGNIAPYGLAWDGTNMWSSCSPAGGGTSGPREIYKHDANGNIIEIWHYPGADGPPPGSYGGCATDIAFVGNRLWYCDYDKNQIIEAIFSQPPENWQIVYQTDFSSDPGWITNEPSRYYWSSSDQTFSANQFNINGGGCYAYRNVAHRGEDSFRLEWDMIVNSIDYAAALSFGLYASELQADAPPANYAQLILGSEDRGLMAFLAWANPTTYGGSLPAHFLLNTWYHIVMEYDAALHTLKADLIARDTGEHCATLSATNVGPFATDMGCLGSSNVRSGNFQCPGHQSFGKFDNVVLSVPAARPPGDLKGRIAFMILSEQKLYVMNADGSSRQQVPLPPLGVAAPYGPQWSRDGLWLTFYGGGGWAHNSQIFIVRPDGSGFRQLTDTSGNFVEPDFSPDGTQIAFSQVYGHLYTINIDGTGLVEHPVYTSHPRWSPDGRYIVYSNWGTFTYDSDLFLYDLVTGQSTQITHHAPGQAFNRADWSPDGKKLAVQGVDQVRAQCDVWTMNADGSNLVNLTPDWTISQDQYATWSPDGRYIVFQSDITSDITGNMDIWYMRPDGTGRVNITNTPEDEYMPAMGTIPEAQPVYYVDAVNGNDNNNGLSRRAAFATIAKGIDSATNRYKVLVYPGVYREEVDFKGKAITVQGVATKGGIPIIENPGDFAVSFYNGEGPRAILKNFVIRNSFMATFIAGSSPTLKNLNIVDNKYGIDAYAGSEPDISSCIFWENSDSDLFGCEARYSCTSQSGQGNIAADPCFVDPNKGDYHLLSERGRYWPRPDVWILDKVTSPCIDGGDPYNDPDDEPMPNGGRIDMGAFGGTPFASMSEIKWLDGDVNHDGVVNLIDFAMLAENWLAGDNR